MSASVDNRVVKMEFDNAQFEQGVAQSLQSLTKLNNSLNDLENAGGFQGLASSINNIGDTIQNAFSVKGVAGITALQKVVSTAIDFVSKGAKSLISNYTGGLNLIGDALSGGQSRARNIEDAKFRLDGLGVAWDNLSKDINYAVKGTAYGLDSAAKAASQLVASGVQYGETFGTTGNSPMAKALRGISGVAAMTNSSYDEIAHIFTTVAGNGKMMTKELRMMSYRGLNVAATLRDYFNGVTDGSIEASEAMTAYVKNVTKGAQITESELRDMVTKGSVSADIFFQAMDHAYGEHATEANKTYAGSLSNVRAALSRLGAEYYSGHMDNMIEVFNSLQKAVDKVHEALTPLIKNFLEFEKMGTHGFSQFLKGLDSGGTGAFDNILSNLQRIFQYVESAFNSVFPNMSDRFGQAIKMVNDFLSNITIADSTLFNFTNGLKGLLEVLSLIKDGIQTVLYILEPWTDVLNNIAGIAMYLFGELGKTIHIFNKDLSSNEGLKSFIEMLREISEKSAQQFITVFSIVLYLLGELGKKVIELVRAFSGLFSIEGITKAFNKFLSIIRTITLLIGGGLFVAFQSLSKLFASLSGNTRMMQMNLANIDWSGFITRVQTAYNAVKDFAKGLVENAPQAVKDFIDKIGALGEAISTSFSRAVSIVRGLGSSFYNAFKEKGIMGVIDGIVKIVPKIPTYFRIAFDPLVGIVQNAFREAFSSAQSTISGFITAVRTGGLNGLLGLVRERIVDLGTGISEAFTEFKSNTIPFILNNLSGSLSNVIERFRTFGATISSVVSPIGDEIGHVFSIAREYVVGFADEFIEAFNEKGISGVLEVAKTRFQALVESIGSLLFDLADSFNKNGLQGVISKLTERFQVFGNSILKGIDLSKVTDVIDHFVERIKGLGETVREFINEAFQSPKIQTAISFFTEAFNNAKDAVVNFFTSLAKANPSGIVAKIVGAITDLINGFNRVEESTEAMTRSMPGLGGDDQNGPSFFEQIGTWFANIYEKASGLINYLNTVIGPNARIMVSMAAIIWGITTIPKMFSKATITANNAIHTVQDGLRDVKDEVTEVKRRIDTVGTFIRDGVKGIGKFIDSTITDITKTAKAFVRVEQFRKTLIPLSIAIATLAASLYVLSKIPVEDLKKAGIALAAAAGTFVVLGLIVTLIDRHFSKIDLKNPQKNVKGALDTVMMIAAAGGALLAASYALKVLSDLDFSNIGPAFLAMTGILVELGAFSFAASKFAPGIAKGAVFLVSLGASLYLSCKAFTKIAEVTNGMRWQDIIKAIGALGGIMTAIGLFAGLSSKFSLSAGLGLIAILGSFFLLEQVFNKIVSMNLTIGDLVTHAEQILGALGLLTLIMFTTKAAGKHAAGGGAAILLMTIAMGLIIRMLTNLLVELKDVSWGTFGKGILTIITVMGMMAVLMASTKLAGAKAVLVMPLMTAMIVVIGAIMGLLTLVAAIAPNALERATDTFGRIVGMLGIMMALTALTHFAKPTAIIGMVAGLTVVCVSLVALSILPLERIEIAAKCLIGIFGTLTALSLQASKMTGKGITGLIIMAGQLLIITGSLIILANQPWEGVLAAAISLGLVIAAIGASMALAAITNISGIIGFGVAVLALIPMVWALQQLASLPWEGMITAATSLGILMVALSAATLLAQGNILGALAFDLMSVGIIALAGALMILSQVDMTNIASQLTAFFIAVGGMAIVGGIVGAFAAPIAIGFGVLVAGMLGFAVGIDAFCNAMLKFSETMAVLSSSGSILGSFISVIQTAGSDLINSFVSGVESVFQNIIDIPSKIINAIIGDGTTSGLSSLAQKAMTAGSDMINSLVEGVNSVFDTITDIPSKIHDTILGSGEEGSGLLSLGKDMLDAGKNGVKGLVSGLTDGAALGELQTAAENLGGSKESGTGVMGWFASMVGYNSPWYETILAGIAGVMGLSEGLSDPGANAELKSVSELLGLTATSEVANGFEQGSGPLNAVAQLVGLDASNSLGTGLFSGLANVKTQLSAEMANLSNMASGFKNFNFFGSGSGAGNGQDGLPDYVLQKQEEYNQMMEQYSEDAGNAADASTNFANATGGSGGSGSSAGKAAKSVKEAAEEALRHEKATKLQTQAIEEFIKTYGQCFGVLDETTDATENAKTAIEDLARTFGLTEDQVADTEAEIEDLFMDMYDTIHDSVDGSMKLFERFSSEMSIAPEAMLRNMRSNFTGIEEWSEEIQMLAAKGFSRGFVEELAKEGPASQAKVRTFLKMTFGQMMEANDLYAKKTDATAKATVKAITAMAFAGKTQDELIRLANDGTNSLQSNAAKASLEAANHAQKVLVTYRELRDTIESTIESQMDLFSEFDKKTETSADQMLKNMASQISGTQEWANGLQALAERGIDDGLLLKLKELGPKGYDQVNAFVQMTAEQLEQANQYYQQSLILPQQVATQVSTSYLNTGLSVAQSMISGVAQGAVQNQEQMRTGLQQAAQGAVAGVKADIQSNVIDADGVGLTMDTEVANSEVENAETTVIPASEEVVAEGAAAAEEVATDAMANAGYNMVAGMVNAMLSAEALSSVRSAAVSLAMAANDTYTGFQQIESPSKVWGGFGLYQVLGLANSMYDNAGIASDAATYLADNANTALQQALNQMNADGLDNGLQPTITPVLDLTDIQNGMSVMNGLLNSQTYAVNGIANIDPASIMNQSFAMLNDAINRLSMAQSQPSVGDINVVVNAQGIDDPNLLADVVAQRIYTEILSREAVVY